MKTRYFIIKSTIMDGEYEYFCQRPSSGTNEMEALNVIEKENNEWITGTFREQDCEVGHEISKREFDIISKYIY